MLSILSWFTDDLGPLPGWAWVAIAGGVLLLIVLLIVLLVVAKKKKAKKSVEIVYENYEGQFVSENAAKIIVAGPNVWLIDANGKTELVKSADDETPNSNGDKIYYVNSDVVTRIVKVGDDFEKIETKQSNYLTVSFVSKTQVKVGETVYIR